VTDNFWTVQNYQYMITTIIVRLQTQAAPDAVDSLQQTSVHWAVTTADALTFSRCSQSETLIHLLIQLQLGDISQAQVVNPTGNLQNKA